MHAQVTYVYHKTGTMGADDWYKNAFKPFLDGGLHSGEVGGPVTGAAFKTVFNVVVLRGREAENETVAVLFVHPKASTDATKLTTTHNHNHRLETDLKRNAHGRD